MTERPVCSALEPLLQKPIKVLDHGFIRLVDYMGNDGSIVQAARVSYGEGTKSLDDDRGLIRYLMRHRHTTPFEMCEIKLHMKMPIFVARQLIRHRTANVNEYSARYSILGKEFYVPTPDQVAEQSHNNKQGRDAVVAPDKGFEIQHLIREGSERAYRDYQWLLNDPDYDGHNPGEPQVARELARMVLPLNFYTEWYWKIDLHNLFHFLNLRMDSHAQYESRVYADALAHITRLWVPLAWEAFEDYIKGAQTLSKQQLAVMRTITSGGTVTMVDTGLNRREWEDLWDILEVDDPTRFGS